VAVRADPCRLAQKPDQSVASFERTGLGTWVASTAGPVNLACRNTGKPDPWPFIAPDWPVTIPHRYRRAGEGFTCGNSSQKKE
jgi:hypothetical protein